MNRAPRDTDLEVPPPPEPAAQSPHQEPRPSAPPRGPLTPQHTLLEAVANTQQATADTREMVAELYEILSLQQTPADLRMVPLTAAQPRFRDERGHASASVGVINPTSIDVLIGLAGMAAVPGARMLSVPPNGALVLPVSVDDVELGVDPAEAALAGGAVAVVFLLRYVSVQPLVFRHWGL